MERLRRIMNDEEVWETQVAFHARQIVSALTKFPEISKIIMLIRHSHIESLNIYDDGLIAQGKTLSEMFGQKLPKNREIRLYYGHSPACSETAEQILDGFKAQGGEGQLVGELYPLHDLGASMDFLKQELENFSADQFIFRWVSGLYPPEVIIPFLTYCQDAASEVLLRVKESPNRAIDIHVTHDLHIMALRLGWLGFAPNEKWPFFMGGLAFTFGKDKSLLFDIDNLISVEFPYWWPNLLFL